MRMAYLPVFTYSLCFDLFILFLSLVPFSALVLAPQHFTRKH